MRKWPLILATRNKGKIEEIKKIMEEFPEIEVIGCEDGYVRAPEVEEDGQTFYENAYKKAMTLAKYTGKLTLADDSGLEVDALEGRPGVLSARFAGEEGNDQANNQKLLKLLEGVPEEKRTARFKCVIVLADWEGEVARAEGCCEGIILEEPRGANGFGYDPLFYLPQLGKTMAELSLEDKNQVSHRSRALSQMKELFREMLK